MTISFVVAELHASMQHFYFGGFRQSLCGKNDDKALLGDDVYMLLTVEAGLVQPSAAEGNAGNTVVRVVPRLTEKGLYFEPAGIGHELKASLLQQVERMAQPGDIGKAVF